MKKITTIAAIILWTYTLQSCKSTAKHNNSTTDTDTTADAAQDTSARLDIVIDKYDSLFVVTAANANMAEVELGRLAFQQGKSKKVKNFGVMMIKDHTKANAKLTDLAKSKNIILPATLDVKVQNIYNDLSKKSGDEFDKAYIKAMIADHQQAVAVFADASKKCQDLDIKAFAIKTLPVLQTHLDAINAIHDSMNL
jgi:putative membrane protein